MTIHCSAVYEKGVLRPLQPLALDEGVRVKVDVTPAAANGQTPAEVLAAIAVLPVEGGGDPHTGRDHDRVLYGDKGAR